ncbi:unnamed protein product [Cochlearia groenlandica]
MDSIRASRNGREALDIPSSATLTILHVINTSSASTLYFIFLPKQIYPRLCFKATCLQPVLHPRHGIRNRECAEIEA